MSSNIVKFPIQEKTAAQVVAENRAKRKAETERFKNEIEELKDKIPGMQEFGKQKADKIDARKKELETEKEKNPE